MDASFVSILRKGQRNNYDLTEKGLSEFQFDSNLLGGILEYVTIHEFDTSQVYTRESVVWGWRVKQLNIMIRNPTNGLQKWWHYGQATQDTVLT
jgi:hypothetical protein